MAAAAPCRAGGRGTCSACSSSTAARWSRRTRSWTPCGRIRRRATPGTRCRWSPRGCGPRSARTPSSRRRRLRSRSLRRRWTPTGSRRWSRAAATSWPRPGPRGGRDAARGARAVARAGAGRRGGAAFAQPEVARLEALRLRVHGRADRGRPRGRRRRSPASWRRWWPSIRWTSGCASSRCSRSIARVARPTPWPPTATPAGRSSEGSASSPGRRCASSKRRSSATRSSGRDLPGRRRRPAAGHLRLRGLVAAHADPELDPEALQRAVAGYHAVVTAVATARRNRVRAARRRRARRVRDPGRPRGRPAAGGPGALELVARRRRRRRRAGGRGSARGRRRVGGAGGAECSAGR